MSRRRHAVLGALALAGVGARWQASASADPAAVRRKIAVATWSASRDGRLMTRLVVDADPALDYVTGRRADGVRGLTPMHVLGAAAARALLAPVVNSRVVGFDGVAVAFAVDIGQGADLAPVKVAGADRLTPGEIATQVWQDVRALRTGTDPGFRLSGRIAAAVPAPLMRPALAACSLVLGGLGRPQFGQQGHPLGAVSISNVGALGIDEAFLAPVPFAPAHVYVSLGTVRERAVVRDGQVVPVRQLTLCVTGDHRLVDGVQCAAFLAAVVELLAHPERLDERP